jgi:hypothetical protein
MPGEAFDHAAAPFRAEGELAKAAPTRTVSGPARRAMMVVSTPTAANTIPEGISAPTGLDRLTGPCSSSPRVKRTGMPAISPHGGVQHH